MSKKGREHLSKDPLFKEIIDQIKLPRLEKEGLVYNALIRSIIYQQLSGKAAGTIHDRFLNLYKGKYPKPKELLKSTEEELRGAGLSRQKSGYVHNVAQFWLEHKLDKKAWKKSSDQEIIDQLTQIKGVGTWTVQMLLMFTLRRPDVLPVDDLVIQNAIIKRYKLGSKGKRLKEQMVEVSKPWSPYRTLASRYLWKWFHFNE